MSIKYEDVNIEYTLDYLVENAVKVQKEVQNHTTTIDVGALCIAQALLHLSDSLRYMTYRMEKIAADFE